MSLSEEVSHIIVGYTLELYGLLQFVKGVPIRKKVGQISSLPSLPDAFNVTVMVSPFT